MKLIWAAHVIGRVSSKGFACIVLDTHTHTNTHTHTHTQYMDTALALQGCAWIVSEELQMRR